MQQAKVAAEYVVDHLNPEDRFNIISFSTGIRSFAPQLVSQGEADNYQAYINSLEAIGGTNISTALLEAAGMVDGKRPSTIIFLTDGLPTEGIVESGLLLNARWQRYADQRPHLCLWRRGRSRSQLAGCARAKSRVAQQSMCGPVNPSTKRSAASTPK